jgi:hypothetical protein
MFSFARISGAFVAGEAAVKAERSEFILSLDGRLASLSKTLRAKEDINYAPFLTCLFPMPCRAYACRDASIRTLVERLMRSVHIGCPRYSRRCHLFGDLSLHR